METWTVNGELGEWIFLAVVIVVVVDGFTILCLFNIFLMYSLFLL
jgi:hypothetical protein